ncbi:MAG: hypothetical protein ACREDT_10220 [Methylocella sp.]
MKFSTNSSWNSSGMRLLCRRSLQQQKKIASLLASCAVSALSLATFASATTVQLGRNQCNLVVDSQTKTEPYVSKPAYLRSYTDPVFGTKVTRITGDPGTLIRAVDGTWDNVSRDGYSDRPVWNADQSLMLLENANGNLFLDGNTYLPLFFRRSGAPYSNDDRWHPSQPSMMLYVANGRFSNTCEFGMWDVYTGAKTIQSMVSGYTGCTLGGTGNWSRDATRVAVDATRARDGKNVVFAVDLKSGTKYPDIDIVAQGFVNSTSVDWVSISPVGDLIYVNGALTNGVEQSDNTMIFTLSGSVVQRWLEYGTPSHSDLTFDASGNEVAVGVAKTTIGKATNGKVIMRNMRTGAVTSLDTGGWAIDTSARNINLPLWSFHGIEDSTDTSWPPYRDEIFAVKLDGSLTVARLAHTHNYPGDYQTQGFVVPSPDGLRFVFSSDWGAPSGRPVQTYVVDMRPLCTVIK